MKSEDCEADERRRIMKNENKTKNKNNEDQKTIMH